MSTYKRNKQILTEAELKDIKIADNINVNPTQMSVEQEELLSDIMCTFTHEVNVKFRAGDAEHKSENGGMNNMTAIQLVNASMDEAIDSYVYNFVLRRKILEILRLSGSQFK